jgi:hypothetical protein
MPKRVVVEEFHLTVFVPRCLSAVECRAVRRTLAGLGFRTLLTHAVRAAARRYRSLGKATMVVTR